MESPINSMYSAFPAGAALTVPAKETVVRSQYADAPELTIVPLRLTALDKGTDYRPVLAEGDEGERIVSRILKRSSNMSGFVNGDWRTQAN